MSVLKSFLRGWKSYLLLGILCGLAAHLFVRGAHADYAQLIMGAYVGVILRDIAWIRLTAKYWPLSDAVTNWDKVDEIIRENEQL